MRETEKEREELKDSLPKRNFINGEDSFSLQFLSGAFITKSSLQNTKKTKSKSYYKGQIGRKQKNVTKRLKRQKVGKVNSGRGEQWQVFASCEISQPCKIFVVVLLLMFSAPLSFWLMTCSFEFDLDFLGFVMI